MGDRISCNHNPVLCHESKLVMSFAFPVSGRNFFKCTVDKEILASSFCYLFLFNMNSVFLVWPNLKLHIIELFQIAVINMCSAHFNHLPVCISFLIINKVKSIDFLQLLEHESDLILPQAWEVLRWTANPWAKH